MTTPVTRGPESGRPAGPPEAAATSGGRLEVVDLTLGYSETGSSTQPVVEGVSFALQPGERIALVGANGSGKSTLLHGLAGLLRPMRGFVTAGEAVVASPSGCTTQHAAYMFQRDLLLPWKTARDNAALAAEIAAPKRLLKSNASPSERDARRPVAQIRARAETLLREFGLAESLGALPYQLSGGMRQRVALARTLILGRGLILLDEPFAALDSLTRADLQEWIQGVMSRHAATWVLVTHDIHEAVLLADRVAVLGMRPARIVGWVTATANAAGAADEVRRLVAVARAGA